MIVRVAGTALWMWCPACEEAHRITVGDGDGWVWNGDPASPTVTPSILVTGVQWAPDSPFYKPNHQGVDPGKPIVCHSHVRNGFWEFASDCTHGLVLKTVPMVPMSEEP